VDRDLRPVAVAGATAIVSCGLLAVAIWRGWLGVDVGRGAAFCEAGRGWAVRQPANTFSNVGFVTAGLLIAWHAGNRRHLGTTLSAHRHLPTVIACIVVLLGPGSAAMHATQTALGGHLDMLSMYHTNRRDRCGRRWLCWQCWRQSADLWELARHSSR